MRYLLFTFSLFFSLKSSCQVITVINKQSQQPIENVLVYEPGKNITTQTNIKGQTDISTFARAEIIAFQHPSFENLLLTYQDLETLNYEISMKEKVFQYGEVVIAANKWEQNREEVPNEILSLSKEIIRNAQAQTAADLLESTGQVFVQKSQLGGGSPSLRGFAANRVLIVVDGVRMNNAIFRSGNLQNIINIDPNAMESAEIVFGPGSVQYGSDALGGVMDFHTLTPILATNQSIFSANALVRYSSANSEKTGHIHAKAGWNKIALASSFSYSNYDDLKTGNNVNSQYPDFGKRYFYVTRINNQDTVVTNDEITLQKFSGFSQWSTIQKLKYRPTNNIDLEYSFYYATTSNFPRYDRLTQPSNAGLVNAEWYYGPQKWAMHRLSMRLFSPNLFYNEARITLSYQKFNESRHDRKFGDNRLRNQHETADVFTTSIDFEREFQKGNLYYGFEAAHNAIESRAYRENILSGDITPVTSRYPDQGSAYNSLAAYFSAVYRLTAKSTLTSGLRYTFIALHGSSSDPEAQMLGFDQFDISNGTITGSLGLTYLPGTHSKIDIIASTGFRSPNIDDIGKVFELDDEGDMPVVIVPNTALKPEYSYNAEVSISRIFSDIVSIRLTGYYSFLDNAIVRGPIEIEGENQVIINGELSALRAQVNTSAANLYGGTVRVEITLPYHFNLNSYYTISKGKDITNNEPLRHTTPNFGKTELKYNHKKLRFNLFAEYHNGRFRNEIPSLEISDKDYLYARHISDSSKDGSPGWITWNCTGTYEIGKVMALSVGLENIFDLHYRPYSSGISAPGRNIIVALRAGLND